MTQQGTVTAGADDDDDGVGMMPDWGMMMMEQG